MSGRDTPDDVSGAPPVAQPPLALAVEAASAWAATQMHLFADVLAAARNFHEAASIPPPQAGGAAATPGANGTVTKEGSSVVDIERDARVAIELQIGTLTFEEGPDGEVAAALVDVIVSGPEASRGTRVRMDLKIPVRTETDSVLLVTESCRRQIVGTLRAAADKLDAMTAHDLVFHRNA